MTSTALTTQSREAALAAMSDEEGVDVLVVGGGVTGAGIALDAVTRGLRTAIVEAQDWAGGTSSRSSKLVHGGLRYLYQLDFKLVAEALKERGTLLSTTAPHLVKAQPFLWPLKTPVIERAYSAVGVGMYDALAQIGSRGHAAVPIQRHYTKSGAKKLFPDIKDDYLVGAIRFYDARVDDARLVIDLVRTAAGHGALAASRTQVTALTKDATGRVTGAEVRDLETGATRRVRARHVIAATGVWTEETEALGGTGGGLKVLASKGVHIVVPKDRIEGGTGLFLRTEKSVLFIIPWDRYWVIGTTDTAWHEARQHPVATSADIDYILEHANAVLARPLTREDIIGTYAGLRPLLQPGTKDADESKSTKVSREHTVTEAAPGLTVIAGGKLTTYRVMAEDAVDFALGEARAKVTPSVTAATPLVGADGLQAATRRRGAIARDRGWTAERVDHLLGRYGSEIATLLEMIDADPDLGRPLEHAPAYLRAEVAFAVTHEGALHVEDILQHRVRLEFETRDRGASAADEIAAIAAPLLGWDDATRDREVDSYRRRAAAVLAAEQERTDADAEAVRQRAEDLVPTPSPRPPPGRGGAPSPPTPHRTLLPAVPGRAPGGATAPPLPRATGARPGTRTSPEREFTVEQSLLEIFLGEAAGTAMLTLLGVGVVANVVLPRTKGNGGGWLLINFGWGLAVFAGVYVAYNTGAHLNPAVTLGLWANGSDLFAGTETLAPIPATLGNVAVYIVAQLVGAFVGAVLAWAAHKQHFDLDAPAADKLGVFATGPAVRSYGWNFITEVIATFVLVFIVIMFGNTPSGLGPLAVALLVVGIGASLGGPTGYAINPARDLGPRIAHAVLPIPGKRASDWGYSWVPIAGPIVGGVLAGLAAQVF